MILFSRSNSACLAESGQKKTMRALEAAERPQPQRVLANKFHDIFISEYAAASMSRAASALHTHCTVWLTEGSAEQLAAATAGNGTEHGPKIPSEGVYGDRGFQGLPKPSHEFTTEFGLKDLSC